MTNELTAERLRDLVAGATPGEWRHERRKHESVVFQDFAEANGYNNRIAKLMQWAGGGRKQPDGKVAEANAALIVALVNAAPQIIALIERDEAAKNADVNSPVVAKFLSVADATEGTERMFDLAEAMEVVAWIKALIEREARMREALEEVSELTAIMLSPVSTQIYVTARAALQPKETDDAD